MLLLPSHFHSPCCQGKRGLGEKLAELSLGGLVDYAPGSRRMAAAAAATEGGGQQEEEQEEQVLLCCRTQHARLLPVPSGVCARACCHARRPLL